MGETAEPTYSISVRLLRTTSESAFVSVPVTADLMIGQPDGTGRIDVDRLFRRAIELGGDPEAVWKVEERETQLHPIQAPPPGPEGREAGV